MKPEQFTIAIPREKLQELERRLKTACWADDYGNDDWRFGVERGWLEGMVHYWSEHYDWRAQERLMNELPHYRVDIDGVPIHFMHLKGKGPASMPIILSHGWPWTFWDYREVALRLADPERFGGDPLQSFDVIVPSLPGYAFSSPLRKNGIGAPQVADLWCKLMKDVLGYSRFAGAGGDWGARVTGELALRHSKDLIAIYLTLPILPAVNPFDIPHEDYASDEKWMINRLAESIPLVTSHLAVHRSDPQTMAYALQDSPLGLAAWIWERRRSWSDCGGDVAGLFGRDFLCTNASLFWLTGTIGTSMRAYIFNLIDKPTGKDGPRIEVPTGFGIAPRELVMLPRSWAEARTNLQRWTILPKGGHFLPAEQPQMVFEEYCTFFNVWR